MRSLWLIVVGFVHIVLSASAYATSVEMTFEPGPKPIRFDLEDPWVPTGYDWATPRTLCRGKTLERAMINAGPQLSSLKSVLRNFFDECEAELASNGRHAIVDLKILANAVYDFRENPNSREVKFQLTSNLSNGRIWQDTIRGLLALQPTTDPRPLVVIKCGLLCSTSDSALFRNVMMQGFDESPFHLLILNGNTSAEYVMDNERISIGGLDEGKQIFELAKWLRDSSPLKNKISSLHLIGVSAGGQSVLYAAANNSYERRSNGSKVINSVASLCPVVNLENSIDFLFNESIAGGLFYDELWENTQEIAPWVPDLSRFIDFRNPPQQSALAEALARASSFYYEGLPRDWYKRPFERESLDTYESFWRANAFETYGELVNTPTLVWAPRNDLIVSYHRNGKVLKRLVQQARNQNYVFLRTPKGSHCGFSLSYGWQTTSAILRGFVMSQSPEFSQKRRVRRERASIPSVRLQSYDLHISQEWKINRNQNYFTLKYKIWNRYRDNSRCWTSTPYNANQNRCYFTRDVRVAFSDLPSAMSRLHVPRTETDAQMLTRWMNANVSILAANGDLLTDTAETAALVEWPEF